MHYYGALPCEVCEDVEVKPREDEIAECGGCNKLMCDDCVMSFTKCDVCLAKFNEDEDEDPDGPTSMCADCMESCGICEVSVHPSCKAEHMKSCNPKGRAMRAVASAENAVKEKEVEIRETKRKLLRLEQELQDTNKVKGEAQKKLRKL
jgi:hypothetical protein